MSEIIKPFKESFKAHRQDTEIFQGFGLQFRDNVTEYFVHPDNESYQNHTHISQAIGEAVNLFCENIKNSKENKETFIRVSANRKNTINSIKAEIKIPCSWNSIINSVSKYIISLENNNIFLSIFDKESNFFIPDLDSPVYEYIPIFIVILIESYLILSDEYHLVNEYIENKNIKNFVTLCETFYQNHKYEEYNFSDTKLIESIDYKYLISLS